MKNQEQRVSEKMSDLMELVARKAEENILAAIRSGALNGSENDWSVACAILKLTVDGFESGTSVKLRRNLANFI